MARKSWPELQILMPVQLGRIVALDSYAGTVAVPEQKQELRRTSSD